MNLFEYKAIDSSNLIISGLCFAESAEDLLGIFKLRGIFAISFSAKSSSIRRPIENFSLPFFRSLHSLISNNIDIITALNIISSSFQNMETKAIIDNIILNVSNGLSFSKSLAKFGKYFDLLIVKTIEIAERTSKLGDALETIIIHIESNISIGSEIRNAIRYPMILLSAIILVTLFWIFFIVPVFSDLFLDIGIKMPFMTRLIIKFRLFCLNNFVPILVFFALISSYFVAVFKLNALKNHKKALMRMTPFVKKIKRDSVALNFFSGMHVMLKEKINLLDALDCLSLLASSDEIGSLKNFIKKGSKLTKAMRFCKIFKNSEISIIEAGERAGDLWPAFKTAEDMLKKQISLRTKKIISLIQPLTVLFIGGIMLIIIYSVLVPMYSQLEIPN